MYVKRVASGISFVLSHFRVNILFFIHLRYVSSKLIMASHPLVSPSQHSISFFLDAGICGYTFIYCIHKMNLAQLISNVSIKRKNPLLFHLFLKDLGGCLSSYFSNLDVSHHIHDILRYVQDGDLCRQCRFL